MQETITLQLGQCGNQIGNEFWNKLKQEHTTTVDGLPVDSSSTAVDKFFYTADNGSLHPRTLLIDTEPRAIDPEISNSSNTFLTNEGTGASNNWAHGYYLARTHSDEMLDLINRNIEACDNLESFQMIHSCAGGTGSGFSSFIAENLKDLYPKKIITDFAVLPNNNEASDVVVQPYNSVLSLSRVKEHCDIVVVMDNYALARQQQHKSLGSHHFESMNSVAADVIASHSVSVRFPGYLYSDARSILNTLSVYDHNLIVPSVVKPSLLKTTQRKYTVGEIVGNLLKQKNMLVDYETSSIYGHLSILNVLDETMDVSNITRSQRILSGKINFLDLPYYMNAISNKREVNVSFNNATCIRNTLSKIVGQFERLKKRNAFVESYRRYELEDTAMETAKEQIQGMIDGYESIEMK